MIDNMSKKPNLQAAASWGSNTSSRVVSENGRANLRALEIPFFLLLFF